MHNHHGFRSLFLFWVLMLAMGLPAAAQNQVDAVQADGVKVDAAVTPGTTTSEAPTPLVGWMEISGAIREGPVPFAFGGQPTDRPVMATLISQMRHVAAQKQVSGLVIYLDEAELDLTQVHALSRAMKNIREQGKKVVVFAEAYDLKSYLLGCAADEIWLQNKGQIELAGLGLEEMYLAGLLEKIGVKMDLLQIGKFKGADETFTRIGPSAEWNLNMDGLLDDLYAQVLDTIAQARGLNREQVIAVMGDSLNMSDKDYVSRGLVDQLVDRHMTEATETAFGETFEWDENLGQASTVVPMDNPFAMLRMLFQESRQAVTRPTIALVHAGGAITSGYSQRSDAPGPRVGLFSSESIGSRTMVATLEELRDDENIKGVVIRLDSPGGSALASEVIWQALRDLAEEKPVYAAIGNMAASGGYYLASACDEVYVSPSSIVGSIGVVGGKVVLGGLYEKLGISVYRRSRGPLGDMFNSVEPFSMRQRAAVESSMRRTYELFIDRVKVGRGVRIKDVDAVAQGRLFTGQQAVKLGMADKVGTLHQAIVELAKQVDLKEGAYDVIDLPEPMTLPEYLESVFGVKSGMRLAASDPALSAMMQLLQPMLGEEVTRQVSMVLTGLMLLQEEAVLAMEPRVIAVR